MDVETAPFGVKLMLELLVLAAIAIPLFIVWILHLRQTISRLEGHNKYLRERLERIEYLQEQSQRDLFEDLVDVAPDFRTDYLQEGPGRNRDHKENRS